MLRQISRPLKFLASWLGGWVRLLLLVLVIVGVGGGLIWERQRRPPLPPQAQQVATQILVDIRQTSFRYPGSVEDVRAFYQQAMPERGWHYCGTQATERCTNMIRLIGESGQGTDVYRRADDQLYRGSTIEIWPMPSENGQTFVTLFETRGR
jgi:hypothetical protein